MRCLNNAAPTKYYYTRDHLGSVYEMTDTNAAVQAAYSYVAYGERTKRWGAQDTEIAYTGHWNFKPASFAKQAASDLSLTWFRTYDPKRGVWLSRDPIEERGGINLYRMVSNGPTNSIDPHGLFLWPLIKELFKAPEIGGTGVSGCDLVRSEPTNCGVRCIYSCRVAAYSSEIGRIWEISKELPPGKRCTISISVPSTF